MWALRSTSTWLVSSGFVTSHVTSRQKHLVVVPHQTYSRRLPCGRANAAKRHPPKSPTCRRRPLLVSASSLSFTLATSTRAVSLTSSHIVSNLAGSSNVSVLATVVFLCIFLFAIRDHARGSTRVATWFLVPVDAILALPRNISTTKTCLSHFITNVSPFSATAFNHCGLWKRP